MMQWLLRRLRNCRFAQSPYSDADVLGMLNDGYRSACERSLLLRAYTPLPVGAGVQTLALPSDWAATIGVYRAGVQLEYEPMWETPGLTGAYYGDPATRSLYLADAGAGGTDTVFLHYARSPLALALTDTPEPAFGREWWWLPYHYAAWRLYLGQGGAQDLGAAAFERQMFDGGVASLRLAANTDASGVARIRTAQEVPV